MDNVINKVIGKKIMVNKSIKTLIEDYQKGIKPISDESFGELYKRYCRKVAAIINRLNMRYCASIDVDGISQDVWLKLYTTSLKKFDINQSEKFGTWLIISVRSVFLDKLRKDVRRNVENFKITEQTLNCLYQNKLPINLIDFIEPLKGHLFKGENEMIKAIENNSNTRLKHNHKEIILKCANRGESLQKQIQEIYSTNSTIPIEDNEILEKLSDFLTQLAVDNPNDYQIIYQYYFEELTIDEITMEIFEKQNITKQEKNVISQRLRRARNRIKKKFIENGF